MCEQKVPGKTLVALRKGVAVSGNVPDYLTRHDAQLICD
jgi:hypothetical protein